MTVTDKAKAVLGKMKLKRLFRNLKARDRVLDEFNGSTLEDVGLWDYRITR
jgi:hypothetical protein